MSLTALIFVCLFALLFLLSFTRPSWAVAGYMLTIFLAPPFWWWGSSIASIRWNLISGFILLGSVLLSGTIAEYGFLNHRTIKKALVITILMIVNATLVHWLLAPIPEISVRHYSVLVKTLVLFPLIIASIKTESDLKIILIAIILGGSYIGYEVTVQDRGRVRGNRLEGVGVANASTANDLACLINAIIPLTTPFILFGRTREKILGIASAPLLVNVLIMCNSRGAFLSLIAAGVLYLIMTPPWLRSRVFALAGIGLVGAWLLLGDPRVIERFMTTFQDSEERDRSAASRLDFWKAGLLMVSERPLGSGGDGFGDVYGKYYIARVTGNETARSVHQGYINEACEWGIQGFALRLGLFLLGLFAGRRAMMQAAEQERYFLVGSLLAGFACLGGLMVHSLFGTFFDEEWGLWIIAMILAVCRILDESEDELDEDSEVVEDSSSVDHAVASVV